MGRSASELFEEAKARLTGESAVTNVRPGTIAKALLSAHSDQVGELYRYIDQRMLNAYVSTATGRFLDELGKLVGASRESSRFAHGKVSFYLDPELDVTFQDVLDLVNNRTGGTATELVIPTNVVVKAGNRTYVTNAAVTLTEDTTDVDVDVLATLAGNFGNVEAGGINEIEWPDPSLSVLQGIIKVTNKEAIESGKDIQNDEDYRFYIANSYLSGAKANETAIRLACLSVPGVADVSIQNYAYGIGTFGIFVTGSSPIVTEGTLQAVQSAINVTQSKGARGVAVSPDLIGVRVKTALTFLPTTKATDKTTITKAAQNAVIDYINNLAAGDTMVINEIIQRVMDVSDFIHDSLITAIAIGNYDRSTGLISSVDDTIGVSNVTPGLREKLVTNSALIEVCYV